MESIVGSGVTITETARGFLVQEGATSYIVEWVGSMLKVHGGGVCYYLVEGASGLEQMNCAMEKMGVIFSY